MFEQVFSDVAFLRITVTLWFLCGPLFLSAWARMASFWGEHSICIVKKPIFIPVFIAVPSGVFPSPVSPFTWKKFAGRLVSYTSLSRLFSLQRRLWRERGGGGGGELRGCGLHGRELKENLKHRNQYESWSLMKKRWSMEMKAWPR